MAGQRRKIVDNVSAVISNLVHTKTRSQVAIEKIDEWLALNGTTATESAVNEMESTRRDLEKVIEGVTELLALPLPVLNNIMVKSDDV